MALTALYAPDRDTIISAALRKIGVVAQGETASADQLSEGAEALQAILKELGIFTTTRWIVSTTTEALVNATIAYTPAADVDELISVDYRDASGNDTPLEIIDAHRYGHINDKDEAGTPTVIYFENNRVLASQQFHVHPVQAVVTTEVLVYYYKAAIQLPAATADILDIPMGWHRYVIFKLASDLADEYGFESEGFLKKADQVLQAMTLDYMLPYELTELKRSQ